MLHFVYGRAASGKSAWLYAKASESARKRRVLIIVPDREAVSAERKCASLEGAANIDVVTFSRLTNYIFRRRGGICESYIGSGAKKIIMYNVLRQTAPLLSCYGRISPSDLSTVEKLTSERTELFKNLITPEELLSASEKLSENPRVAGKLSDLALIFSAFDSEVAEKWSEPDGSLSKAYELCGDFFKDTDVYIDSFLSFTKEQYKMLSAVFSGASETYVSLSYIPDEDGDGAAFVSLSETDERLHRTAVKAGVDIAEPVIFGRSIGYKNDELAFLSENLFSSKNYTAEYRKAPEHISVTECRNKYEEAESVAVDISKRVRAGVRYRDMAVIVRDTEDYDGILDAEFEKAGIPYYVSRRADIDERGIVKFIYSAYACVRRGFLRRDIIEYIKTDYSGISGDECDLLENYIIKWKIQGKKFSSDEAWTFPLRGYDDRTREGDEEALETLGILREKVKTPLLRFAGALRDCKTVRDHAKLLYDFLVMMEIPEKLNADAALSLEAGDASGAEEFSQLWKVLCDALDQTALSAGDKETDADGFLQLLKLAFSETDIGSIPTSVDEVLIGGAAMTRPEARIVYIVGATDGVFPKRVTDDGMFSEYEKNLLRENGVDFSSRLEKSVSDEYYYFYTSVCAPQEELFITYVSDGNAGRCSALGRIEKLFPQLEEIRFEDVPEKDRIYGCEAALEYALSEKGEFSKALFDYLLTKPDYAERLSCAKEPMSAEKCRLSRENAEELFSGSINTSYSRLENYIKCRFQYFCCYELDLSDDGTAGFSDMNIGNFLHATLEAAAKLATKDDFSEEETAEAIRSAAEKYIRKITGRAMSDLSPRLRHMTDYLCGRAMVFAKRIRDEFSVSKFRPVSFELSVGGADGVEAIKIENEQSIVKLFGRIDRVDAYDSGDGKLYLRVVDYKKNAKKFDLEKISAGLDMQMLLYLFSLWENGEKYFGKEIVPAGVIYVETNPKAEAVSADGEGDGKFAVSGVVTEMGDDGLDLARAMEPELKGVYSPIKGSSAGKAKNIIGLDALRELKQNVVQTVLGCAAELKKGLAYAAPTDADGTDPCKYCRMKAICRVTKKKGSEDDENSGEYT